MGDHIVNDMGKKCADDVSDAMMRTLRIIDTPQGAAIVATFAAAAALGIATGAFAATIENGSPEETADALWVKLRPMVVRSAAALNGDG